MTIIGGLTLKRVILKSIVGIIVGIVKKQKQESPKTLGLQRVVYFLV